jgi:hypothetical protein
MLPGNALCVCGEGGVGRYGSFRGIARGSGVVQGRGMRLTTGKLGQVVGMLQRHH